MHVNNFFVCGPKFMVFFSSNVGGVVVAQLLFRFSICGSVSEIFAIKVESCQKSCQILDVLFASQILGGRPFKNCTHVITPDSQHVIWIKICDNIPISPELIDVHTLNFKPNFKFSRLKFFLHALEIDQGYLAHTITGTGFPPNNYSWKFKIWLKIQHMHVNRLDWIEQGLTSPPTQYRLSGRQFYRSKDPTNSIKVLKDKLAS